MADHIRNQRHVLVGIDGSPESLTALRWAHWFATTTGRRLRVAYAWQRGQTLADPEPEGAGPMPEPHERGARSQLQRVVLDTLGDAAAATDCVALRGDVAAALAKEACRNDADLLVVGARGRGSHGTRRARLGSVSKRLIECPGCTVAVIPSETVTPSGDEWSMVVGVDGSAGSSRAVHWAAASAVMGGGDVVVVHAFQPPEPDLRRKEVASLAAEAERRLTEEWCGPLHLRGVLYTPRMERGDARHVIPALARAEQPACVVLGSRGLGALSQRLLGSVTRAVVTDAERPTVIVPAPRDCLVWSAAD